MDKNTYEIRFCELISASLRQSRRFTRPNCRISASVLLVKNVRSYASEQNYSFSDYFYVKVSLSGILLYKTFLYRKKFLKTLTF